MHRRFGLEIIWRAKFTDVRAAAGRSGFSAVHSGGRALMGKAKALLLLLPLGVGIAIGVFLTSGASERAQNDLKSALERDKAAMQRQVADAQQETIDAQRVKQRIADEKRLVEDDLDREKKRREDIEGRLKASESRAKQMDEAYRKLLDIVSQAQSRPREVPSEAPVVRDHKTEFIKCTACKGAKFVFCQKCAHTGKSINTQVCPDCGGVKITCEVCKGAGNIVCAACAGKGTVAHSHIGPFVYNKCGQCGGTGRVDCPGVRCAKGVMLCEKCRNRGKITTQEPCQYCDGKGRMECALCQASGEIEKK